MVGGWKTKTNMSAENAVLQESHSLKPEGGVYEYWCAITLQKYLEDAALNGALCFDEYIDR